MLLTAAACLFVLSTASLLLWLRGRPGSGRPLCRRCRFDLTGMPQGATCPECGADLTSSPRAVRVDRRRRSPLVLLAAALMMMTAVGLTVPSARARLATVDWNDHKPTWWLVRETRSTDLYTAWPALSELLARFDRGEISDETVLRLAVQALDYRDNGAPCGQWPLEFGNFVDLAWERGLLTQEQKFHYAFNAAGVWWSGPNMRKFPGAPANPMMVIHPTLYAGISTRSESTFRPVDFEVHELTATLDDEPLPVDLRVWNSGDSSRPDVTMASAIAELPMDWVGREMRISWHIQIVDFQSRAPIGEPWIDTRTFTLDKEIEFDGARRQDDKPPPEY